MSPVEKSEDVSSGAPDWLRRPVMVWGMQKTGSSLLLSLLDGHPEVLCFPDELRIKYFLNRGPWSDEAELRREYLRQIWKGRAVNGLLKIAFQLEEPGDGRIGGLTESQVRERLDIEGYASALRRAMDTPLLSAGDLFSRDAAALYGAIRFAPPTPPRLWLFKMVGGEPAVGDTFLSLFPSGRIVYIVRDPRGGLSSRLKDWRRKRVEPADGAKVEYLNKYCRHYLALKKMQGRYHCNRILVVRYEDVVADVASSMHQVLDFLEVAQMERASLTPHVLGLPVAVWNADQKSPGVFSTSAEEWKTNLSASDRALAEQICKPIFEKGRFGYKMA